MQKVFLLILGAAWVVVLVPPMFRARLEGRPTSSVDHFRRNLAVLQQSAPQRINPLQSMGRPLTNGRQGLNNAVSRAALKRTPTDPRLRRSDVPLARRDSVAGTSAGLGASAAGAQARHQSGDATAPLERRGQQVSRANTRRQIMRRRREKTVRLLVAVTVGTGVLGLLAKSPGLVYACAISAVALFFYCAKLLRIRREAELYAAQGYQRYA